ncbi:hypothetical protein HOY82DRAFT_613593 [Tuber indicum]|nr:hypothetical protein HOY82DRAFT_613593 [Tuber indicum]
MVDVYDDVRAPPNAAIALRVIISSFTTFIQITMVDFRRHRGSLYLQLLFLSITATWSNPPLLQKLAPELEFSYVRKVDLKPFVSDLPIFAVVWLPQLGGFWHEQIERNELTCSLVNRFNDIGSFGVGRIPGDGARNGCVLGLWFWL